MSIQTSPRARQGRRALACTFVQLAAAATWVVCWVTVSVTRYFLEVCDVARDNARGSGASPVEGKLHPSNGAVDDTGGGAEPSWVPPVKAGGRTGPLAVTPGEFWRPYPVLRDFLTLTGVGGANRKTGTLLVFAEDGKWKSCLNDRDGGNYCFASADTVEGLLEALDKGLRSGVLDWRASKGKR